MAGVLSKWEVNSRPICLLQEQLPASAFQTNFAHLLCIVLPNCQHTELEL